MASAQSGSITTPSGGTVLYASADVANGSGCSCPSGFTQIDAAVVGSALSGVTCQRLAAGASASYNFQCNGSSSGVNSTMYALGNVDISTVVDSNAKTTVAASTAQSATITPPSLTYDHDLVMNTGIQASCTNNVPYQYTPGQLAGWDYGIGQTISGLVDVDTFGINWDHLHPKAAVYRAGTAGGCSNPAQILFSTYFKATTPVAAATNHFLPYRDFTFIEGSSTSFSYSPDPWVQSGDLMVCNISRDTGVTPVGPSSAPAGWTPALSTNGATACVTSTSPPVHNAVMCSYVKKAGTNEYTNTYTWTWADADEETTTQCGVFYSVDTSGSAPYLDAVSITTWGGTVLPDTAPSVTPSQAGDLIIHNYLNLFGAGAISGGNWWISDTSFTDGNEDDPTNAGSHGAGVGLMTANIQPTSDPTGLHGTFQKKATSNGWAAFTQAFKLTAAPALTNVAAGILANTYNPASTSTITGSAPCSVTAHFIPYGSISGDLYITTDEPDSFNANPVWINPFGLPAPAIASGSNNTSNAINSSVSDLIINNGSSTEFWTQPEPTTSCVVSYGIDSSFRNATLGNTCATSIHGPAGPSQTGCTLTAAGPTFDVWAGADVSAVGGTGIVGNSGDTFVVKSSTTAAPTGLNDWMGWQTAHGSYTPTGTTPGSGDNPAVSEFSLIGPVIPGGIYATLSY
jgi:hypothetical protein